MSVGIPGPQSLTIEDLPKLVAAVAAVDPDRVALSHGGTEISYGRLNDELVTLDTAMGGALGADALVPVVVSTVLPELIASEADGLGAVVDRLIADGTSIVEVASEADAHVTLAGLFDEQVERTPDALALDYAGTQLTYAQFDARANRLARELVAAGVGPDSLVGLAMRRSNRSPSSRCTRSSRPAARTFHSTRIILPTVSLTYSRSRSPRLCSHVRPMPWCCRTVRPRSTSTPSTCRVVPRQLSPTPTGWRRCARTTLRMSSSRPDRPDAPKALQSLTVPSSRTCNGVRPSTDSLRTT
ncbi:hypothetical protein CBI33_30015 [Rhodococcus erythropolis]|nr:hypothetical protein CBI33_30015 [Rhodococcus erythropolis]